MDSSLVHNTEASVLCILLFIAMIGMVALGRIAGKLWRKDQTEPSGGMNSLLTVVFALFGFILAFTFGMSGNRYDNVRMVVLEEVNDIGTAVLRSDLYSDSVRDAFRSDFKKYVEARIAYYNPMDTASWLRSKKDASLAAASLWARAMQQSKEPNMLIPSSNMIPALNAMFDIATTSDVTLQTRVPDLIVYMLFVLALASSFIGGFTSRSIRPRDWIIVTGFALLSSMIIYITLDLARPLRGIIKADMGTQAIVELRNMF